MVLVGPMAVGKTTVAHRLASRLGWPVRDSDEDLRAERGFSGRELAATAGVEVLHRWECAHLRRSVASPSPAVVAAAASVVDDPWCRQALADQFVVWLRASAATRAARSAGSRHRRALGADPERALAALADQRAGGYAAVADMTVDAEEANPDEIVAEILDRAPVAVWSGSGDLRS